MKTFDEIARKLFAPGDAVQELEIDPVDGGSEFVVPECWKPKTYFQAAFLYRVLSNASDKTFSEELKTALSQCIDDFMDSSDLQPKTYKELLFANASVIEANKMLPKTPEELAFALLASVPVEFSDD